MKCIQTLRSEMVMMMMLLLLLVVMLMMIVTFSCISSMLVALKQLECTLILLLHPHPQVKCLQKFLLDKGMFKPEDQIEDWVLDGLYGPKTEEAVAKWTAQGHEAGQLPECDMSTVDRLADACCKLDLVRQYGMLNYIALLKIVKKHAKWSKSKSIQVLGLTPARPSSPSLSLSSVNASPISRIHTASH